jgi:hypothetical protein
MRARALLRRCSAASRALYQAERRGHPYGHGRSQIGHGSNGRCGHRGSLAQRTDIAGGGEAAGTHHGQQHDRARTGTRLRRTSTSPRRRSCSMAGTNPVQKRATQPRHAVTQDGTKRQVNALLAATDQARRSSPTTAESPRRTVAGFSDGPGALIRASVRPPNRVSSTAQSCWNIRREAETWCWPPLRVQTTASLRVQASGT